MFISFLVALVVFFITVDDSKKVPPKPEPAYVAEVKAIQKQTQAELERFYTEFEGKYEAAQPRNRNHFDFRLPINPRQYSLRL